MATIPSMSGPRLFVQNMMEAVHGFSQDPQIRITGFSPTLVVMTRQILTNNIPQQLSPANHGRFLAILGGNQLQESPWWTEHCQELKKPPTSTAISAYTAVTASLFIDCALAVHIADTAPTDNLATYKLLLALAKTYTSLEDTNWLLAEKKDETPLETTPQIGHDRPITLAALYKAWVIAKNGNKTDRLTQERKFEVKIAAIRLLHESQRACFFRETP